MLEDIERVMGQNPAGAEPLRHDLAWLVRRSREVFSGVDLEGKRVLEIGSGTGLFCFYAASQGAAFSQGLEPEAAGSTSGTLAQFRAFREASGATNVETLATDFQSYDPGGQTFDVVLSYNSINHLDEEACRNLQNNNAARGVYRRLLQSVRSLLSPTGAFIIWDVARTNAWNALSLRNPMEPTIEWDVHQNPEIWTALLCDAGFTRFELNWPTYHPLRLLAPLLNNRVCSYLTSSRFRLVAR